MNHDVLWRNKKGQIFLSFGRHFMESTKTNDRVSGDATTIHVAYKREQTMD